MNESVFTDKWSSLSLSSLVLVTFPRNKPQIVRKCKSAFVWKLYYGSFCIFEVVTYFLAEKSSFTMDSGTLLNIYNS